ncbi:MAG: hypothetical protein JNL32_06055, partial [Candidatus Kapabacteria bacterium]|nr:hypothetical protein [Candidatus Kapabacteria bacterium]
MAVFLLMMCIATTAVASMVRSDSSWYGGLPNPDSANLFGSLVTHRSQGWFPQPYRFKSFCFQSTISFNEYEYLPGDALRSKSFATTPYPFSKWSPYEGDEEDIAEPN